jgi:hypothetical protein
MKAQLLAILMMGSVCSFAKDNATTTSDAQQLRPLNLKPYGSYGGSGGGGNVHFSWNAVLGYAGTTINNKFMGGSFFLGGCLGVAIEMPSRSDSRTGILSAGVGLQGYDLKDKYTDNKGKSQSYGHMFTGVTVPISYLSMMYGQNGEEGRGFYWELGSNINYTARVAINAKNETNLFNRFQCEPMVSFGLHTPFVLRVRSTGAEVGEGRVLIGLYGSYVVNNIVASSTNDMHNFKIGIKWHYIFM